MPKSISIYIPDELIEKMEKLPEVNWSEIARQCIENYVERRKQPEEEKLRILSSNELQLNCSIMPMFYPRENELSIGFLIENPSEEDVILDRIWYWIKLTERRAALETGPSVGLIIGTYLEKDLVKKGGKLQCYDRPHVCPETLEQLLHLASEKKDVSMRLDGWMFFDSKRGIVKKPIHSNLVAEPFFFLRRNTSREDNVLEGGE